MNIPENFDRWMFDYMEGNLSSKEAEDFEQFLVQNPGFEVDAEAWGNTVLPQEEVIYPYQQQLERKRKVGGWYAWSAAAVLVVSLLSGGYFLLNRPSDELTNIPSSHSSSLENYTESAMFDAVQGTDEMLATDNAGAHSPAFFRTKGLLSAFASGSQLHERVIKGNSSSPLSTNLLSVNAYHAQSQQTTQNHYDDVEAASTVNADLNSRQKKRHLSKSLKQEQEKLHANAHAGQYKDNPALSHADLDLSKKSTVNFNSFENKTKRIYRKIEKMFGYPVALVNLRDPELLLPENGLVSSNPGFAGGMLMPRFEMAYRNQWLGSEMNGQHVRFSFDNYIADMRGGLGIAVNASTYALGVLGDYSVDLTYSPKITINKNIVFEPGIKVSLGAVAGNRSKLNPSGLVELDRGLVLENSFDEATKGTQKLWYQDYGVGFVLNTSWFYAGFSADNLGRHFANVYLPEGNVEPVRSPILYNGIIGADYESRDKSMTFSPFVSARQFGQNSELWAGMNYRLNHFTLGGSYSTNQDFTAAIGLKFKHVKFIYQYDRTHTLITHEQIGSHNLSIRINGDTKKSRFK